jgi:acyl-CoA synthetase (AMP-forming)/AMP-acid ligase II
MASTCLSRSGNRTRELSSTTTSRPTIRDHRHHAGRFHTGDIGFLDQDGFVTLVDRKKGMILSGGFNVFPRNIEEAIYEHPAVAEVTAIGIPDAYRGQSAKAFVALKPGRAPFGIDELQAFLADKLAKYEMPTEMEIRGQPAHDACGEIVEEGPDGRGACEAATIGCATGTVPRCRLSIGRTT